MEENQQVNTKVQPRAYYSLIVLTLINLINYLDRYVPAANKDLIKKDLLLSDTQTSLLSTAFVVVFTVFAPIFGILCDRGWPRKILLMVGTIVWSISAASGFFVKNYASLLVARMAVGIGEAVYGTIAIDLLSDLFPPGKRNKALICFLAVVPLGAALSYGAGSAVASLLDWRYAFLITGLPGIPLSFLLLFMYDPGKMKNKEAPIPFFVTIKALARNPMYVTVVLGMVLNTWGLGAFADWLPTFLQRNGHLSATFSTLAIGGATIIGSIVGTIGGAFVGDLLVGKVKLPYLFLSFVAQIVATLAIFLAILVTGRSPYATIFFILLMDIFGVANLTPTTTLITNHVHPLMRARAISINSFLQHVFGDAISPVIVGAVSDATGNLFNGVILIPVAIFFSALCWTVGYFIVRKNKPIVEHDDQVLMKKKKEKSEKKSKEIQLTESHSPLENEEKRVEIFDEKNCKESEKYVLEETDPENLENSENDENDEKSSETLDSVSPQIN